MSQAASTPQPSTCRADHLSAPPDAERTDVGGLPGAEALSPLRKAALLVVSLDEPTAARLLTQLDRAEVEAVTLEMARLDAVEPDQRRAVLEEFTALGLRRLRFLFDDISRLADRDIRAAYDDDEAPTWALALAGAPRALRSKVLGALRTDSARALERRLTLLGPFRLDDAEAAQADIAERLRRLHDQGRISLPDPDENEDILV